MRNRSGLLAAFLLICLFIPQRLFADIDWSLVQQFELGAKPLDTAVSEDGRMVFVLTEGEILVYAPNEHRIIKRIPLDQKFDKIEFAARGNLLVLTSSTLNAIKMIRVDQVYPIDISQLAFKGPENAPVVIAVFEDYQ